MSLDFNLINETTERLVTQIAQREQTACPDLFLVNDVFPESLLDKLTNYAVNKSDGWVSEVNQKLRTKLNWESDSVIEELHISLENLTEQISDIFHRKEHFLGLSIWKDLPGYKIKKHTDNPEIDAAMQVYLLDGPQNLGTIFEFESTNISVPYRKNCGYLASNRPGIPHYLDIPVPDLYTRYSLYAIWSKDEKIINIR
jgi:hypothetical protein